MKSVDAEKALSLKGVKAVVTAKDLGVGIHIRTADSGGSVLSGADELVIEGSGDSGMTILSGTSGTARIAFGDSGGNDRGIIDYSHGSDILSFVTAGTAKLIGTDPKLIISAV